MPPKITKAKSPAQSKDEAELDMSILDSDEEMDTQPEANNNQSNLTQNEVTPEPQEDSKGPKETNGKEKTTTKTEPNPPTKGKAKTKGEPNKPEKEDKTPTPTPSTSSTLPANEGRVKIKDYSEKLDNKKELIYQSLRELIQSILDDQM